MRVVALAIAAAPGPAAAKDMDHSGNGTHHSDKTGAASEDVSGAEDILEAYRAALVSRDAAGMSALFAEASAIFENGKSEGSFANYMEHHLGPELDAITSFTFTDPTLTMTRKGHMALSLLHIRRCRRIQRCTSLWVHYHQTIPTTHLDN